MAGSETSELAVVWRTWGKMQAEVIKGRLETAGIPVLLGYESVGQVYGLTVDGLGEVRIMVPHQYVQDAEALLTEVPGEDADDPSAADQL